MSAESPRHARTGGGPQTVPAQPPTDRGLIDAVSGFISDVTLSSSHNQDPKDVIQWARFETADINEPWSETDSDNDIAPLLLLLGYGAGVQVWLVPPTGEAQEVLSWRQGTVRVLRILPSPQRGDCFASKRPLVALCDSAPPGPAFCSLSFISIRGGEQVKSIKFKNQIIDVLANKRSVVVSFSERFAVFDAGTLEDRVAITTCFPCPCPLGGQSFINPLALGDRWLAYADKKINQSKRSSGGCEGEGQTSYTATVLHAAKSLSKGLRGLGESVAHSLAGGRATSQSPSPPNTDSQQPGVVTVLDIEGAYEEQDNEEPYDPIVAHFIAHSEAIIALAWDASGLLLVTADRRGHDFHVFRLNPHPLGGSNASVHHLYVLHRGDTTAKVQDIAISPDSRWAAISTLRGTTHIFPISPYGGPCGVRTHTAPRVVNRLSRFHRSAGLPLNAPTVASGSPVNEGVAQGQWFPNPRLPPYPQPTVVTPLAQLRPTANLPTHTITRTSSGRQRLSSQSEDCNTVPLLARARFGVTAVPVPPTIKTSSVNSLYLVAASGCLSHIALHPKPQRNIPKEKVCDESPIELEVEPLAQWGLQRVGGGGDLLAPLPNTSPLLAPRRQRRCSDMCMSEEDRWLSQVEIVTHAGPHRRLWMGPQFVFKTYNFTGSNSSLSEAETVEVELGASRSMARSNPVNMPGACAVPVLIDTGSPSSLEHSPCDSFRRKSLLADTGRASSCDVQLKEDLAEAMKEDQGWREGDGGGEVRARGGVARVVDPIGTVLAPTPGPAAPPLDNDDYTTPNADEATFRPVVRAPATLTLDPDNNMLIRPLPRTITIPVQNVSPLTSLSPEDEPVPLNTDVFIPVELNSVRGCHASNLLEEMREAALRGDQSKSIAGDTDFVRHEEATRVKVVEKFNKIDKEVQERESQKETVNAEKKEDKEVVKPEKSGRPKEVPDKVPKQKETSEKTLNVKNNISTEKTSNRKEKSTTPIDSSSRQKDKDSKSNDKISRRKEKESTPIETTPRQKETTRNEKASQPKELNTDTLQSDKIEGTSADNINNDKVSLQKDSTVDKPFSHKESTPKLEKSSRKEETTERKPGKKEKGAKNEKPSGQKDVPIKLEKSTDQNMISEKDKNIVEENPKKEIEKAQTRNAAGAVVKIDIINLDNKQADVNKDLKAEEIDDRKRDSESARGSAERAERDDSKSLPKSNRLSDDIQSTARTRVKKSPTLKSVSDSDSEVSVKNKTKTIDETTEVMEPNEVSVTKEVKEPTEFKKQKDVRESRDVRDGSAKEIANEDKHEYNKNSTKYQKQENCSKLSELSDPVTTEPSVVVTLRLPTKKDVGKSQKSKIDEDYIKTEEQAWDMLLSEPEKPVILNISDASTITEKSAEEKPKSKKSRKMKKSQEETQAKTDEDSFVEIHAIEEKQQICSEDLVSISTPFEDIEPSFFAKANKTRSPEKNDDWSQAIEIFTQAQVAPTPKPRPSKKHDISDIDSFTNPSFADAMKEKDWGSNTQRSKKHVEGTISETTSILIDSYPKSYKSKSLSPYPEPRKPDRVVNVDKDVYVIDTTEQEFPEIQITRGNKASRRSPQPAERKTLESIDRKIEKEPVAQTIKSWSSIAATKNKKSDDIATKVEVDDKFQKLEKRQDQYNEESKKQLDDRAIVFERPLPSTKASVEDKLYELYKRSDIKIAECDAPSELNFIDEHHSCIDLPPLEPLDFGLDDFKLEVMRDSLLDINDPKITSPICKINIDDILSSIKDTTSKAIESSAFNLIDLEKIPARKEKGFSVISSQKITSQEVKLDDDSKEEGIMEKSDSSDNTSPVVTTDSDKEDKKCTGASNLILPSSKQSVKSKKPRRKKK